jgi:pyruvate, water dikinase
LVACSREHFKKWSAFAAEAYRHFLREAALDEKIGNLLGDLNTRDFENLRARGNQIRHAILSADVPRDLEREIVAAYDTCRGNQLHSVRVVRASSTDKTWFHL